MNSVDKLIPTDSATQRTTTVSLPNYRSIQRFLEYSKSNTTNDENPQA